MTNHTIYHHHDNLVNMEMLNYLNFRINLNFYNSQIKKKKIPFNEKCVLEL